MATYPATPQPLSTEMPSREDLVLRSQFDGGGIATRSKYLRPRRRFVLNYTTETDDYLTIVDFVQEVRGSALTFDWTNSQLMTIAQVRNVTPINVLTQNRHGLQDKDVVIIAGADPSVDGLYSITREGTNDFNLVGTTASGVFNQGTVAWHFPKMRVIFAQDVQPAPTKLRGPVYDNQGIFQYQVTLEEDF